MLDFMKTMAIASSGLRAQNGRMRVIAENMANSSSTATRPGGDPYRRKIVTFRSDLDRALGANTVSLGKIQTDGTDFRTKYEPGHPAADANGYVKYPNVNELIEMNDMREAERSYQANLNIVSSTRRMVQRTLDLLKG